MIEGSGSLSLINGSRSGSATLDFLCYIVGAYCLFVEQVGLTRRFLSASIMRVLRDGQGVTKRCRLSWLTSSAYMRPNAGGRGGRLRNTEPQAMSIAVQRSPNKHWRSNSIFNLWWRPVKKKEQSSFHQFCDKNIKERGCIEGKGTWGVPERQWPELFTDYDFA
jgi:hypothetical protein